MPSDFRDAKAITLENLSKLAENGEIYGAKVFGSVAKGTPNERSDFDLLVITEKDDALPKLRKVFSGVRRRTNVGIEPVIVSRRFAVRGFHSIDNLFLEHIRSIPLDGNIAGSNPFEVLRSKDSSESLAHKEYLAQKLRRLQEGMFKHSTQEKYAVLQRALEAPVNVGRRTLQVLPFFGLPIEMKNDGKQAVVEAFQKGFERTIFIPPFEYLLAQDMAYTTYLREALNDGVSGKEYNETVNELFEECVPRAIHWVSDISLVYSKLLEGTTQSKEGAYYSAGSKERL